MTHGYITKPTHLLLLQLGDLGSFLVCEYVGMMGKRYMGRTWSFHIISHTFCLLASHLVLSELYPFIVKSVSKTNLVFLEFWEFSCKLIQLKVMIFGITKHNQVTKSLLAIHRHRLQSISGGEWLGREEFRDNTSLYRLGLYLLNQGLEL